MRDFDLRRFDLNLLTVFDALMRERHVGRAGERLHLTQPAVSHALGRLRALLGDPLFVKHARGMNPTPRAAALAPAIAATLASLSALLAPDRRFEPASARRVVTLAATDYVSFVLLPALVERLRREAPGFDLRVRSAEPALMREALRRGEIDFALGRIGREVSGLEAVPLFEERFVCVGRTGHPLLAAPMAAADFAAAPQLLVSPGGDAHGMIDAALQERALARRVVLTVPHFLAVPFIVAQSDLVAALAERVARRLAAAAVIDIAALPLAVPPWRIGLVRLADTPVDPALAWFARELVPAVAAGV
jgi:DNA-binding transcriptional LysR family regulator